MPCIADLSEKSKRENSKIAFACPICRLPLADELLGEGVEPVVLQSPMLQDRLRCLPLQEHERLEVARSLILQCKFVIEKVLSILDSMLTDSLQASLRRSQSFTPVEKQEIYEDARRPVDALREECYQLTIRLDSIRDQESDIYVEIDTRIHALKSKLIPAARESAHEQIFERINSAGNMRMENELGEIEVDFSLYVDEAKKQFDEQLLPILKAVGRVILVVGRGNHIEGGVAKLKPAQNKKKIRHVMVTDNDGLILVKWKNP